jgi:Ras-related GTP-binding protein A/B
MDLLPESKRERVFEQMSEDIRENSMQFNVECFMTSIWDETLYKAWSQIVHFLLPNIDTLKTNLA